MGQISDALCVGPEFQYKDKVYNIHPLTFEVQGHFERYMERQARESYFKLAPYLPAEEKTLALDGLRRELAERYYTFGNEGIRKALEARPHLQYLCFLMLKKNHPELMEEDVAEMFRDDAVRDQLIFTAASATPDPNSKTGAKKTE